jgi:hypothetical protein
MYKIRFRPSNWFRWFKKKSGPEYDGYIDFETKKRRVDGELVFDEFDRPFLSYDLGIERLPILVGDRICVGDTLGRSMLYDVHKLEGVF